MTCVAILWVGSSWAAGDQDFSNDAVFEAGKLLQDLSLKGIGLQKEARHDIGRERRVDSGLTRNPSGAFQNIPAATRQGISRVRSTEDMTNSDSQLKVVGVRVDASSNSIPMERLLGADTSRRQKLAAPIDPQSISKRMDLADPDVQQVSTEVRSGRKGRVRVVTLRRPLSVSEVREEPPVDFTSLSVHNVGTFGGFGKRLTPLKTTGSRAQLLKEPEEQEFDYESEASSSLSESEKTLAENPSPSSGTRKGSTIAAPTRIPTQKRFRPVNPNARRPTTLSSARRTSAASTTSPEGPPATTFRPSITTTISSLTSPHPGVTTTKRPRVTFPSRSFEASSGPKRARIPTTTTSRQPSIRPQPPTPGTITVIPVQVDNEDVSVEEEEIFNFLKDVQRITAQRANSVNPGKSRPPSPSSTLSRPLSSAGGLQPLRPPHSIIPVGANALRPSPVLPEESGSLSNSKDEILPPSTFRPPLGTTFTKFAFGNANFTVLSPSQSVTPRPPIPSSAASPSSTVSSPRPFVTTPTSFVSSPRPFVTTPSSFVSSPRPSVTSPSSFFSSPRPSVTSPSSFVSSPRPSVTSPSSFVSSPRPSVTSPSSFVSSPRPSVTSPFPSVSSPRPSVSSPFTFVSSPRPSITSPSSFVSSPRPSVSFVSSPRPSVTSPFPFVSSQRPSVSSPSSFVSSPRPATTSPQVSSLRPSITSANFVSSLRPLLTSPTPFFSTSRPPISAPNSPVSSPVPSVTPSNPFISPRPSTTPRIPFVSSPQPGIASPNSIISFPTVSPFQRLPSSTPNPTAFGSSQQSFSTNPLFSSPRPFVTTSSPFITPTASNIQKSSNAFRTSSSPFTSSLVNSASPTTSLRPFASSSQRFVTSPQPIITSLHTTATPASASTKEVNTQHRPQTPFRGFSFLSFNPGVTASSLLSNGVSQQTEPPLSSERSPFGNFQTTQRPFQGGFFPTVPASNFGAIISRPTLPPVPAPTTPRFLRVPSPSQIILDPPVPTTFSSRPFPSIQPALTPPPTPGAIKTNSFQKSALQPLTARPNLPSLTFTAPGSFQFLRVSPQADFTTQTSVTTAPDPTTFRGSFLELFSTQGSTPATPRFQGGFQEGPSTVSNFNSFANSPTTTTQNFRGSVSVKPTVKLTAASPTPGPTRSFRSTTLAPFLAAFSGFSNESEKSPDSAPQNSLPSPPVIEMGGFVPMKIFDKATQDKKPLIPSEIFTPPPPTPTPSPFGNRAPPSTFSLPPTPPQSSTSTQSSTLPNSFQTTTPKVLFTTARPPQTITGSNFFLNNFRPASQQSITELPRTTRQPRTTQHPNFPSTSQSSATPKTKTTSVSHDFIKTNSFREPLKNEPKQQEVVKLQELTTKSPPRPSTNNKGKSTKAKGFSFHPPSSGKSFIFVRNGNNEYRVVWA